MVIWIIWGCTCGGGWLFGGLGRRFLVYYPCISGVGVWVLGLWFRGFVCFSFLFGCLLAGVVWCY